MPGQESRHHAAGEVDRSADAAAGDDGDGLALVERGDRIGLRGRACRREREQREPRIGAGFHFLVAPAFHTRSIGSKPHASNCARLRQFALPYAIFRSFFALPANTFASSAGESFRSRIIWMPSPLIAVSGGASVPNTILSAPTVSITQRAAGR